MTEKGKLQKEIEEILKTGWEGEALEESLAVLNSFMNKLTEEQANGLKNIAEKRFAKDKVPGIMGNPTSAMAFGIALMFSMQGEKLHDIKEQGAKFENVNPAELIADALFEGIPTNDSGIEWRWLGLFENITKGETEEAQNLPAAYSMVTNSALPSQLMRILNNPNRIVGRGVTVIDGLIDGEQRIEFRSKDVLATIGLANFMAEFNKQVRNGAKALKFFLEKATDQHTSVPVFSLSELVNRGIYTTEKNAYTGLKNIIGKLLNIKIHTEWTETIKNEKTGKKESKKTAYGGTLIGEYIISTSRPCKVSIHTGLYILSRQYFTVFPAWGWALPDQAFILLDYILYVARQRTKEIKDSFDENGGKFEIKIDTIREKMGLPTPKDAGYRHQQLIIDPIENAIVAIEDMQNKNGQPEITITPVYDETGKIADFLEGHLEIGLKGKVYDYMATRAKAIEDHTPPKIAEAQTKRRTRAKTKKEGGNQQ